jgi:hypothetical protein
MKNKITSFLLLATSLVPNALLSQPVTAWSSTVEKGVDIRILTATDEEEATDAAIWFAQSKDSDFGSIGLEVDGKDLAPNSEVTMEIGDSENSYTFSVDEESWIHGDALNVRNSILYCALLEDLREGDVLFFTVAKSEGATYVFSLTGSKRNLAGFAPGCD